MNNEKLLNDKLKEINNNIDYKEQELEELRTHKETIEENFHAYLNNELDINEVL